jgi:hypothetical protein
VEKDKRSLSFIKSKELPAMAVANKAADVCKNSLRDDLCIASCFMS